MKTKNAPGQGRKSLPASAKRVRVVLSLPPDLAAKLSIPPSKTIEMALLDYFSRTPAAPSQDTPI